MNVFYRFLRICQLLNMREKISSLYLDRSYHLRIFRRCGNELHSRYNRGKVLKRTRIKCFARKKNFVLIISIFLRQLLFAIIRNLCFCAFVFKHGWYFRAKHFILILYNTLPRFFTHTHTHTHTHIVVISPTFYNPSCDFPSHVKHDVIYDRRQTDLMRK